MWIFGKAIFPVAEAARLPAVLSSAAGTLASSATEKFAALLALCVLAGASVDAGAVELPAARVGMPVRLESLVLPGARLEARPLEDETPVVLRVAAVYPHGAAFRYDLEYRGLEPGAYDLRDFLQRADGSSADDLPPMPFTITSALPAGQIEPHALSFRPLPWLGGYRLLLILGAVVWIAGLVYLLYPRRKPAAAGDDEDAPPLSLADRLRPLVVGALEGRLSGAQLAELERSLVGYWRRRLALQDLPPEQALQRLREHEEAGPLLNQLEAWLHRPTREAVDVAALLAPYRDLPPEAIDDPQPSTREQPA